MTLAAAERLDDAALLEAADPSGMLRQVASAAAQVRAAARAATEADLGGLLADERPRAIVVTGMGGSGIAGEVLAAVAGPGCPVQVTTVHDYRLPGWVGAAHLGILDVPEQVYESAAAELERVAHLCRPDSEAFVNPAKVLALDLSGTLPMIWGTSPLAGVASARFANQLHENGKYPAIAGVLPEANHNQVVVFDGPFVAAPGVAGQDQEPPVPLRLVLLRDTHEHPQVARRREESARIAAERGIEVTELAAAGDQPLERLASLVQLIDYASVYLAIANGIDPAPIAAIQELKARIS